MNRYRLSTTAVEDLDGILDYVSTDSGLDAALGLHGDFARAFQLLADHPGVGHRHAHIADKRTRVWTVHSYLIIYWPKDVPLGIARIVHGHRDMRTIETPRP